MTIENLPDTLKLWLDSKLLDIHTGIPGKIEKYSGHDSRKATVKPLINVLMKDGESLDIPPIDNVPVIFNSSSKFQLLYPLKKGDGVMIFFSETGIGGYLDGQGTQAVDPDDTSRFSWQDAICVPGLWPFSKVPKGIKTIELTEDGKLVFLEGTESFVLGDSVKSELTKHLDLISTLQSVIGSWTPVPNDGGAKLKTDLTAAGFFTKPLPGV